MKANVNKYNLELLLTADKFRRAWISTVGAFDFQRA
jgi:hypothetical protein